MRPALGNPTPPTDQPDGPRRPLADLHRHLVGSIRISTILEVARREGHPLASDPAPGRHLVADEAVGGLLPYLARVDLAAEPLVREEDWARAVGSVEAELVALDVLHHEARLVVVIGGQQSHAYCAQRDQPCAFGPQGG